jgi:subtilase family serine protease
MPKSARTRRGTAVETLENRLLFSAVGRVLAHPICIDLGSLGTVAPDALSEITPAEMVQAYGVNQIKFGSVVGDGSGQTIAIVDAYGDPTAVSDLATFNTTYNLPAMDGKNGDPSFTQLDENGGSNLPGSNSGWLLEESLDIEWAHVIAPKANIILYEANSASDADLIQAAVATAAKNPNVTEVSMSWGSNGEFSGETTLDSYFTSTHATFLAATGDGGYPGGYPAYSKNVVAVGGTSLTVDSAGNYSGETAWSGSGGGTSSQESEPTYQVGYQNTLQRTIPDVSMDADPNSGVPVYLNGAWHSFVGGTSLACPMWAGLIAIANQGRVLNGLPVLNSSQALPLLYQSASNYLKSPFQSAPTFHDITSGNNINSNGGFSAGAGYDEVTGLGSPVADLLTQYLAGTKPSLLGNPVINGDNPNGLYTAAGQGTNQGVQRSMVEDVVYTFNEPVTIANANTAFTVVGTGPHPGTAPSTLIATAVPGSDGAQWAVSLTGKPEGTLASIANGEYSITVNPSGVVATDDGTTPLTTGRTDTFYRLFGDINGDKVVNVSDEFQFSKALNAYNPAFDYNGDGVVNLADEFQASKSFSSGGYVGDGFVTTI